MYCRDDRCELVDLCRRYLAGAYERRRVARNAREYFDRFLRRDPLVRYDLHRFLSRSG